jgi:hypothetical protein
MSIGEKTDELIQQELRAGSIIGNLVGRVESLFGRATHRIDFDLLKTIGGRFINRPTHEAIYGVSEYFKMKRNAYARAHGQLDAMAQGNGAQVSEAESQLAREKLKEVQELFLDYCHFIYFQTRSNGQVTRGRNRVYTEMHSLDTLFEPRMYFSFATNPNQNTLTEYTNPITQ